MAIVLLHFARMADVSEFGRLSSYLLFITYSAFSVFGINASFVKEHSFSNDKNHQDMLTNINLFYTLLTGIAVFTICFILNFDEWYSLGLISLLGLMRGCIQTILRARSQAFNLSIFNILFALSYALLYFLYVAYPEDYQIKYFLNGWLIALSISITIVIFLVCKPIFNAEAYMLDKVKPSITRLLSGSALLFLVNIGNLIFISFDRVLLNLMAMPSEKIGLYQFADNISSIFHLGSSAILFLLTPIYLRDLSNGTLSQSKFKSKFLKIAIFWIIPLIFS